MRIFTRCAVAALILATGVAMAQADATDPNVIARQGLMKIIAKNTKVLGEMAGGKTDYDESAATAAKQALSAAALEIPAKFKTEAGDPDSEAKPVIWTDWAGFTTKAKGLEDASQAIDVSSLEGVKAGMGAIAGACKDCHQEYRIKK